MPVAPPAADEDHSPRVGSLTHSIQYGRDYRTRTKARSIGNLVERAAFVKCRVASSVCGTRTLRRSRDIEWAHPVSILRTELADRTFDHGERAARR